MEQPRTVWKHAMLGYASWITGKSGPRFWGYCLRHRSSTWRREFRRGLQSRRGLNSCPHTPVYVAHLRRLREEKTQLLQAALVLRREYLCYLVYTSSSNTRAGWRYSRARDLIISAAVAVRHLLLDGFQADVTFCAGGTRGMGIGVWLWSLRAVGGDACPYRQRPKESTRADRSCFPSKYHSGLQRVR